MSAESRISDNELIRRLSRVQTRRAYAPRRVLVAELGAALRARRRWLRLTMRQAADMAGISAGYLCDLEHAKRAPSAAVAEALSRALQLPDDLARWLTSEALDGVGKSR